MTSEHSGLMLLIFTISGRTRTPFKAALQCNWEPESLRDQARDTYNTGQNVKVNIARANPQPHVVPCLRACVVGFALTGYDEVA
jgi:hypothetical protein